MLIGAPKLLAKGTSMKLRSIALFLAIVLATAAAHAQAGVYVTMDAQQFSQIGVRSQPAAGSGNTDRPWLFGPGYGVYLDITHFHGHDLKTGPVVFGIDVRGDTLRRNYYGSQYDRQDGLFSIRVATKNKYIGGTPYVIGGFGIGHTRIPSRTTYNNNIVYQVGVGLDRKIHGKFDWRLEATGGALGNYPVGYAASQSNYLVTLATGVVFHLK
jgi:hypothetical protein